MSKPTQWADRPFELLPIPGTPGAPSCSNAGVMAIAIDMANVHNTFLRGLNSIYLQIPYINLPTDISDLLLYIKAWADSVHHHHSLEESFIFPRWGTLLKEAGITEDVMSANVAQHDEFEPKMLACLEWCEDVRAGNKEYDREELVSRIDGFAKVLMQHLHDEIETLMKLDPCDGKAVKKIFDDGANEGLKTADTSLVVPLVFGCVDKTFPGGENFPPVPFFFPYLNAYWFSRKHSGAWRLNPCDVWGRPQPLHFLPKEE